MYYSKEFKQKVIDLYGGMEEILRDEICGKIFLEQLESGDEAIGIGLRSISQEGFLPEEIVEACTTQNYQGIYQKAKRQLAARQLFEEWRKMQAEYFISHGRFVVGSSETKMQR